MRINWFKDENHLVYINGATQLAELEKALHAALESDRGSVIDCAIWMDDNHRSAGQGAQAH